MATILPVNITPTPEQIVAQQIDAEIRTAAIIQKRAYDNIRRIIYGAPGHARTDEQVAASYAAFQANTSTGLTADQLGQMARLVKASINTFQPGAITDNVPQAVISFE